MQIRNDPAYEYADVDLEQRYSKIASRAEIDLTTRFSRNRILKRPFVSAAMDTVTGAELAIVMAQEGGIGVLPRFANINDQVREVERVKHSAHFIIDDPHVLAKDHCVDDASAILRTRGIGGVIIVDDLKRRHVVGVVSRRDVEGEPGNRLLTEVMNAAGSRALVTASIDISLEEAARMLHVHRIEKLPLVDSKGILQGLVTEKDIELFRQYPNATRDARGRLAVAVAVGIRNDRGERYVARAEALVNAGADIIVIDVAHGGMDRVMAATQVLVQGFPDTDIVAGNVMTAELAQALAAKGAAGVKVGIAPGYACRTRNVTGVGGGQLTAVLECVNAANRFGIPVCADGGIRELGDIGKAIAAGGSTVMMGALFAGTEESPGSSFTGTDGRKYKLYRGMSSLGANLTLRNVEGQDVNDDIVRVTPEGEHLQVPAKGSVREILAQMEGALRSTMSYVGAATIAEMPQRAIFRVKARNG